MSDQDHFTTQADAYRQFRPVYPAALFDWLAQTAPTRGPVWDCGCGNGQASGDLATRFAAVIATDLSAAQIGAAPKAGNIHYAVASASAAPLRPASVDLVTVAQALHWFDHDAFYAEVRRVLKPGGRIACWSYGRCAVDDAELDAILQDFYDHEISAYWPAERHHIETGYRELPFPFARQPTPALALSAEWTVAGLLGYVASWSASVYYARATGQAAADVLAARLPKRAADARFGVRWPLTLLVGRP